MTPVSHLPPRLDNANSRNSRNSVKTHHRQDMYKTFFLILKSLINAPFPAPPFSHPLTPQNPHNSFLFRPFPPHSPFSPPSLLTTTCWTSIPPCARRRRPTSSAPMPLPPPSPARWINWWKNPSADILRQCRPGKFYREDGLAWKPGGLHRSHRSRRPWDFHAIAPLKGRSKGKRKFD